MRDSNLCFEEVTVRRLYGQDHHFTVSSLCEGVNVIVGPNASGKTTLARAMAAVLWPEAAAGEHPELQASFTHDGDPCAARLNGSKRAYQRDGRDGERPVRIASSHRDRYHLYLHELLALTGQDDTFAEAILKEAAGGYDLQEARAALDFEVHSRREGSDAKRVHEAREALQEAKSRNDEVERKRRTLDRLRRRRDEARAAKHAAAALREALALREARRALDEAKMKFDAYPDRLEHVQADDAERLQHLADEVAEAEEEIREARGEKQAAEQTVEDDNLPEGGIPENALEELEGWAGTLNENERAVQREKKALAEAQAKACAAWQGGELGLEEQEAESLSLPALSSLRKAVKEVHRLCSQLETRRFLQEIAEATGEAHDVDALQNGMDALAEWRQSVSGEGDGSVRGWRLGGVALGLALLAAGVAGFVLAASTGPAWPFVVLIVGGVLVALGAWIATSNENGRPRKASDARERYDALGFSLPKSWSEEAVRLQSETLRASLVDAEVEQAMRAAWARWEKSWDGVEGKLNEAQDTLRKEAHSLGLDSRVVEEESFLWVVDRLGQWQEARGAVEQSESGLRAVKKARGEALDAINERLASCDQQHVGGAEEADATLASLQKARQRRREAAQQKQTAEKRIGSAETKKERAEANRASISDRLDLPADQEHEVTALVEQQSAYESAKEERSTAKTEYDTIFDRLKGLPGCDDDMVERSEGELREHLEEAQEEAGELDDIAEEITRIEQRVEQACEGYEIEKRHAQYRLAVDDLGRKRERDYGRAVGAALSDFVQQRTRDQDLPAVFTRAQELFVHITKGDYRLDLDRANQTFRAITSDGRGLPLGALSSGTKMQLLLAVRVAFVEMQEQVCKLPLILDELLANSDDGKADAIIEALKTVSREGRQIVYLTAQTDEVRKWQSAMQNDELPLSVISLDDAALRERPEAGDGAMLPVRPPAPTIEKLHEVSHDAYHDLAEVPRWTPRQPVGALHLWYLVEDVPTLHGLLNMGLKTWGAFQNVVKAAGLANMPVTDRQHQSLQAKAQAVEAWRGAWHVGRGKPVRRATLEETEAVSGTFIDRVAEKAQELDGDGDRLVEALRDGEVKRFHGSKTDELEAHFVREGHIDRAQRLSSEEMWQRVIANTASALEEGTVDADDLQRTIDRFA